MWTGTQFTGSLAPGASGRWFTYGWPASWHVVWYFMPTAVRPGAPELDWDVAVERYEPNYCTYWLTVRNESPAQMDFEGRFAVLN